MAEGTIDLGKVGILPRGDYDEAVSYERLDLVSKDNGAYLSLKDDNVGHEVTDTDWWFCVVTAKEALDAAKAAETATENATDATQKAIDATTKADTAADGVNEAVDNAVEATGKAQAAADAANEQVETIVPLISETRDAIKIAQDSYNLVAEATGYDKFANIPASMDVQCETECVIGGTVVAEVTIFPPTANQSKVFIPLNYKGEIHQNGEITADEECDVKLSIVPTGNSNIYKTVTVHFREPQSRLSEDGTARTTEEGEEIVC